MIGDPCPKCTKGTIKKYNFDRGFYCTHGCVLYGMFKTEKQTTLFGGEE